MREKSYLSIIFSMCRLFGFRSNVPSRAHGSLVAAENALARQAEAHRDGWGIGYFMGNEAYILKSEAGAAQDERFDRISRRLESHTFVVHVRRATVGQIDYLNSHPFRHGNWIFAHNGTVYGFEQIRDRVMERIREDLRRLVFGSTDSEHIFYYLVSALDRAGISDCGRSDVDVERAAKAISEALGLLYDWTLELGLQAPLVNFILTNGRQFFAQQAGIDLYLASQKIYCADYETCSEPEKICMDVARPLERLWVQGFGPRPSRKVNHMTVTSERIGKENIWEPVPAGALVALDEEFNMTLWPAPKNFRMDPAPAVSTACAV
jgi:predicted glutamine amidotransferase